MSTVHHLAAYRGAASVRNERAAHADLLAQVAASETERDEVRRVLGMYGAPRCLGDRCMQGRLPCPMPRACHPVKLNEATLDRRHAWRDSEPQSLPDLLLAKGSMTGPHRRTVPALSWKARFTRFVRGVFDRAASLTL